MNKRHYEHTLPNIRGSLSNTYIEEKKAVLLVQEKTRAKGHEITQAEEQQQPEGIAA